MNFGRFERNRYKSYIVPTFGNFLKNCYCKSCCSLYLRYSVKKTPAPDECRARGLAISLGYEAMIKFDFEGVDVNVDSVDPESAVATPICGLSIQPTSGSSALPTSGSSTPFASTSATTTLSAPKDAHVEDEPSSTTAPSIATEKTVNVDEEPGANGILGGLDDGADGVLGGQGDDDDAMGITPPPSPMFHSSFDLPLSPVLREEELVPDDANNSAPAENPVLNEVPAPIAIVSAVEMTSATALSSAATTAPSVATAAPAAPESPPTLLKYKKLGYPVLSNGNGGFVAKRLRHGTIVESGEDAPTAEVAKLRKGRKQQSASVPPATGEPLTLPSSSSGDPAWLKSAVKMLTAGDLGDRWTNVVDMWVLFEHKETNLKPTVLGSSHRPPVVHDWIQRARSAFYCPTISSVDCFETLYKLWWASLQPDWRVSPSSEVAFAETSGNWDVIHKPGKNGVLSVAAALFFWGLKVKNTEDTNGWETAVEDLLVVLTGLLK